MQLNKSASDDASLKFTLFIFSFLLNSLFSLLILPHLLLISPSFSYLSPPWFPCVYLLPVNSYGGDDDDGGSSSSDSEDEILKQFEISVSRSQSFRTAAANGGEHQSHHTQLPLSRRHKFTRLSDQEEGSTEPSDCEGFYCSYNSMFQTSHYSTIDNMMTSDICP